MSDATESSSRVKKRSRQKANQQKRSMANEALVVLRENPTFANAFRAWLAHTGDLMTPQQHRSATKFVRSLRNLSSKGTGEPDYPETARISVDTLVKWVDDLAWSLNVKYTLKENAANLKTPTSRVGDNFRSLVSFLEHARIFSEADVNWMLEICAGLEEDLARTARINRIMELYVVYVQEAYFDAGRTVDESFWGEYVVDGSSGRRTVVLRNYDEDESDDDGSSTSRAFQVHFPSPLVDVVKKGDTLTLQLCHLEQGDVWVPYMYSGFTPTRDDEGTVTPTERQTRSSERRSSDPETLQASLAKLELSSRRQSAIRQRDSRSRTPQRRDIKPKHQDPGIPGFDFHFDEGRFTDAYFNSWEGDIDTDEDFADIVSPPEGHSGDVRGQGKSSSSEVNLYYALKERHS